MIQESIFATIIALIIGGGLSFVFRAPVPAPSHARLLLVAGLISSAAMTVAIFGTFAGAGFARAIAILSAPLAGLLYILAGLGFRRAWHTGSGSFALLFVLVLTGALLHLDPVTPDVFSLWLGLTFKGASCICLLHALFSLWSGRRDDMDISRLTVRYPLTVIVAITLTVTLISSAASNISGALLVQCWLLMAASIFIIRIRNNYMRHDDQMDKLENLRELFDRRRIYREDDLTLERIGDRLLLGNEAVRRLVHRGLGFRRLGDLLDRYRVKAAQVILEDADQVEMSLSEVAISVGYTSILPFEAAFGRLVGQSARDYRQRHLEEANANRPLQLTNSDR